MVFGLQIALQIGLQNCIAPRAFVFKGSGSIFPLKMEAWGGFAAFRVVWVGFGVFKVGFERAREGLGAFGVGKRVWAALG